MISSWTTMKRLLLKRFMATNCAMKGVLGAHSNGSLEEGNDMGVVCSQGKVVGNKSDNMPTSEVFVLEESYSAIIAKLEKKDESNDEDLEESFVEEQSEKTIELRPDACSTNVPLESNIDKHDESSIEILVGKLSIEMVPVKSFSCSTIYCSGAMQQTEPSTSDGHEKSELMSLAELCNMEMLGKILTRKFDPGGIGQDKLLWFHLQDLLNGKHTLCHMSFIEFEFQPYVINARSKVVENKFRVLGDYELMNLSMPMLFGKFSKGSYEKSLFAVSKMDVVQSCHEYVDFWYSSYLFLFDPGGEFRSARTWTIKLMAEVIFNLPPPLMMCPSNVRYIVMASVITTLNAAWEMVERTKEHQVIENIQGSEIPNIVDKCREEIWEHLWIDAHDPNKALRMFSFDDTIGEALKLFGYTLNELFHVIRRRDWKTYCRCLVDWPINVNFLEKVCKLVAFNLLSFEIVHDLKECGDRERDSSAYGHYVTNFVMFCGMIMVSFDPGGKRRIVPKPSDKIGPCLLANQEVHCPVDILWVGNMYRNAGHSLGVKGDNHVHGAVKMVWIGYRDGWYTIQRWKIPRGLVEDMHWHTDEENASFIFDSGGAQRLTATGNFGRSDGLMCSRMVNLLKSQVKISARILFVYSFRYSIDPRYTRLYCSLWSTAKIMAMISWRNMNGFSPYRKKLNMPALLEFSTSRSSDFHSVVACASYRLPVCMFVIIMAMLQRGFSVVGDKYGLDLIAMHDSAIQHVDFGLFVHVSSVIRTSLQQVVQYTNIATEGFLALLMHPLYASSKQDISQVVTNRKMLSAPHLQLMPIIAFHAINDYKHWADVTARLPMTMHDKLTQGRVIHLEGWKGEKYTDMEKKLITRECIIDSCVINLCKNGQTLKFFKLVNGLDPPKRHIGEPGDCRPARLVVILVTLVDKLLE